MYDAPEYEVRHIALERHYMSALDQASILVAMSRCRLTDREPLFALRLRQQSQYIELLHEFCYSARRAIELAEHSSSGILAHATAITLRGDGDDEDYRGLGDRATPLTAQSLWWVLSRVIHSRELAVVERLDDEVGSEWARAPHFTAYWASVGFEVGSDFDSPDVRHLVLTERHLEAFIALHGPLSAALQEKRKEGGC